MIVFRFVIRLEEVDDVERTIDVHTANTLKDFSDAILASVGFDPETKASFYLASDNWRKGQRFSNHIVEDGIIEMMTTRLMNEVVNNPHQRFLYYTDDEMNWEMQIELTRIFKASQPEIFPKLIKSAGPNPKQFITTAIGTPTNEFEQLVEDLAKDADLDEEDVDEEADPTLSGDIESDDSDFEESDDTDDEDEEESDADMEDGYDEGDLDDLNFGSGDEE